MLSYLHLDVVHRFVGLRGQFQNITTHTGVFTLHKQYFPAYLTSSLHLFSAVTFPRRYLSRKPDRKFHFLRVLS